MDNKPLLPSKILGNAAERTAELFLVSLGYRIHARNVRVSREEIDILAFDPVDEVLVFAEVKARQHAHPYYRPELNLDRRKRRAIIRAARRWVADHGYRGGYRLDLLCVVHGRVTLHLRELGW